MNGNHQNHEVKLCIGAHGNCDCGDSGLLKSEGFCSKHQGTLGSPDLDQLDLDIRNSIITLTEFIFSNIEDENSEIFFSTLSDLASVGDIVRRCIAIGMKKFMNDLVGKFPEKSIEFNLRLINFFGQMINDSFFLELFSESTCQHLAEISTQYFNGYSDDYFHDQMEAFCPFFFHAFSQKSFDHLVENGFQIAQFFSNFFYLVHSFVIQKFDTIPYPILKILMFLYHHHDFFNYCSTFNKVSIAQQFFELLFESEFSLECSRPYNPLQSFDQIEGGIPCTLR